MKDENLVTEEVAALFRTSPATIRYWRYTGKGPASFKVGRRVLYPRAEVERYLQEVQQQADAA